MTLSKCFILYVSCLVWTFAFSWSWYTPITRCEWFCCRGQLPVYQLCCSLVADYNPPTPPKGSGPHRYYLFVFKQKEDLGSEAEVDNRCGFSVVNYKGKFHLTAVASNMFTTENKWIIINNLWNHYLTLYRISKLVNWHGLVHADRVCWLFNAVTAQVPLQH